MEEIKKITEICEPLVQYLKEHYDSHTTIVITMDEINLLRTEIHVPLLSRADENESNQHSQ